jgi:hypothetical protein
VSDAGGREFFNSGWKEVRRKTRLWSRGDGPNVR